MKPQFNAFNEYAPVQVHHGGLPRWQQDSATYFTTFRLADSIPRNVVEQWNHEKQQWLETRGIEEGMEPEARKEAYRQIDSKQRENFERQNVRRLFTKFDQCHGSCILKMPAARRIVEGALLHFNNEHYHSGDVVIMPNYVHWIVQPIEGFRLEKILQYIKRFSSTQLTKRGVKEEGRLWQSETYDRLIRDRCELNRIRKYIADNPSKDRLSEKAFSHRSEDWLDS